MHLLRLPPLLCLLACVLTQALSGAETPRPLAPPLPTVWELPLAGFDDQAYEQAVERAFALWEEASGQTLRPGAHRRAGIKVFTGAGLGIATPKALTRGVIRALERRGFARSELFLLDQQASLLRAAGYLPALSAREAPLFEGVAVLDLFSEKHYDALWFYESPLPPRPGAGIGGLESPLLPAPARPEERKSFLPLPLLQDTDFWINLPMGMEHPGLGVSGALANPTLWGISNHSRFHHNPASAPLATSEIAAIPELRQGWVLNLLSLERWQYIGGTAFHSLYTVSEPRLWVSADPVALDALLLARFNRARELAGFPPLETRLPLLLYARALGLGDGRQARPLVVP